MNFSDLQFNTNYLTDREILKFQQKEIQVIKYLPISDKLDLIQISLQKAQTNGTYNQLLLEMYFHLNLIYLYTNIEFSEEDRQDEMKLYDILETNGIIDQVVEILGDEYKEVKEMLIVQESENLEYENSAAAVFRRFVRDLPEAAAAAKEIVDSFDPDQYQKVRDFAIAANGGRNIITNQPVQQETVPISPPAQTLEEPKLEVVSANKKD